MRKFEYKAVPAPTTITKAKGVKTTDARFALSLTNALNEQAEEGWEYVRAETLPCTERKGLTGSQQTYQNILIFRRLENAALPLEAAPEAPSAPPPAEEPVWQEDEPPVVAPPINTEPPQRGNAPSIRAVED